MKIQFFLNLLLIVLFPFCSGIKPIVLVPGLGGSQFEARLNKTETVHVYCEKVSDWYLLWLSVEQLFFAADCMVDNMRLTYNETLRITQNQPGVELRQPGFGDTTTVEFLDPSHPVIKSVFEYFDNIVEMLVQDFNYTRNVTVRGAPYDFRKAPNEMKDYLLKLTNLIEETYCNNGNQKVILIGHSMGNNYLLYLLNNKPQVWKDKYIDSYISLSAPWAGSVKPLALIASGDPLGQSTHIINPIQARPLQQSMPSTAWLMPYDTHWGPNEVLVIAPTGNYTVNDYEKFTKDVEFPASYLMRQDTELLIKDLKHPGVKMHIVYGYNVSTPAQYNYKSVYDREKKKCRKNKFFWFEHYKNQLNEVIDKEIHLFKRSKKQSNENAIHLDQMNEKLSNSNLHLNSYNNHEKACVKKWFDYQPDIITGEGDGTVNIRSLKAANSWEGASIFEINGGEHLHILHNMQLLNYLKTIITA